MLWCICVVSMLCCLCFVEVSYGFVCRRVILVVSIQHSISMLSFVERFWELAVKVERDDRDDFATRRSWNVLLVIQNQPIWIRDHVCLISLLTVQYRSEFVQMCTHVYSGEWCKCAAMCSSRGKGTVLVSFLSTSVLVQHTRCFTSFIQVCFLLFALII